MPEANLRHLCLYIYQQTFIDTYAKVAFAKLYDRKTALGLDPRGTAADLLNDRVVPFHDEHDIRLCRVLTDRGTEHCGNPERHEYELYLAVEDVDHSRTRTKRPQTNGICERFHKTVLDEFYRVAFRKKSTAGSMSCRPISILDGHLQRAASSSRPLVLRQDPDADLPRRDPSRKGKTHGSLTTTDIPTGSHRQHRPSDSRS